MSRDMNTIDSIKPFGRDVFSRRGRLGVSRWSLERSGAFKEFLPRRIVVSQESCLATR
jgi:hypothetical protein